MRQLLVCVCVLLFVPTAWAGTDEPCEREPSRLETISQVLQILLEWDDEAKARGYQAVVIDLASDGVEKSLDLSVRDALDLERLIYEGLHVEDCELPAMMRSLRDVRDDRPIKRGGSIRFFVDLDPLHELPERAGEFKTVERVLTEELKARIEEGRARGDELPRDDEFWTPPARLPEAYYPAWERLVAQIFDGSPLLIEIELDGDPTTKSTLEMIAIRSLESVIPYAKWTKNVEASAEYSCTVLEPWLWKYKRETRLRLDAIKQDVQPDFFSNPQEQLVRFRNGKVEIRLGSHADPARVQDAMRKLIDPLMEDHWFSRFVNGGCYQEPFDLLPTGEVERSDLEDFADTVNALHVSPLTGPQTHWFKLLQDLPVPLRQTLLRAVAQTAVTLSIDPKLENIVMPPNIREGRDPYDRAELLRRVLVRTMYDLDYPDRDRVITDIRDAAASAGLDLDTPRSDAERDLARWVTVLTRLANNKVRFENAPANGTPVLVGEYYGEYYGADDGIRQGRTIREVSRKVRVPPPRRAPRVGANVMTAQVFMEGGGGKGMAYPKVLGFLENVGNEVIAANAARMLGDVRTGGVELRETGYGGASAGAINAGLAAAEMSAEDLSAFMQQLDFTVFFRDHVPLMGGTGDRRFRGLSRTGLFSTSEMYRTLDGLLRERTGIHDRPVLFQDLDNDLTVVTQLVSRGNLPDDLYDELVGDDGMITFSKAKTPFADVATALTASAAIPAFFNSPVIHVGRMEDGVLKEYYFRVSDGGAVKNLPVDEALTGDPARDAHSLLVMLPVYTQTEAGQGLSTLKFGPTVLETQAVDDYNERMLAPAIEKLGPFLEKAHRAGYTNVVFALDLTEPEARPGGKLVIQGTTRERTLALHRLARSVGVPHVDAEEGARIYEKNLIPASGAGDSLAQYLLDSYLDGDGRGSQSLPAGNCPQAPDGRPNVYSPGYYFVDRGYHPPERMENVDALLKSVLFSGLVAVEERAHGGHLFEN